MVRVLRERARACSQPEKIGLAEAIAHAEIDLNTVHEVIE
jgi:hypothetical protein